MRASHWESYTKPRGAMKVNSVDSSAAGKTAIGESGRPHSRGVSRNASVRLSRRTESAHAGTRKMVNYAWSGRSQGKP